MPSFRPTRCGSIEKVYGICEVGDVAGITCRGSRSVVEDSLAAMEGGANGLESGLKLRQAFEDSGAALAAYRGSQELALTDELLIEANESFERRRLLSIALGHAVVFLHR